METSTTEDTRVTQAHRPFKRLISYILLIFVVFLLFVIAVSAYNLWYFGTTQLGPYYINAWQPQSTNEPYFNFGRTNRENALKQLLGELPKDTSKPSLSTNTAPKKNPISVSLVKFPTLDFKTPDNWIVTTAPDGNGFDFESRRHVFCGPNSTKNFAGPDCKAFTTQAAYDADAAGIVWGSVSFSGVCNSLGLSWLYCGFSEHYDIKEFIAYKDVFLPSIRWPKVPPCEPTDISNKSVAEVVKVAGFVGLMQKSEQLCLYESYDGSSELYTNLYYYIPVGGTPGVDLLTIRIAYVASSPEALRELSRFVQVLNTMVVKIPQL